MAIVVPAWEIGTLLELPIFQEQRRKRERIMETEAKPEVIADAEFQNDNVSLLPATQTPLTNRISCVL
jgi:hypothetical protein